MAIDFAKETISFHAFNPHGSKKPHEFFGSHTFPRHVKRATCAINGFHLHFGDTDHNIQDIQVDSDVEIDDKISPGTVSVKVQLIFADQYEDPVGEGFVSVVIIAELADK
jgi:hypothetical protein